MDGQIISSRNLQVAQGENKLDIPVNSLATGTYFLRIIDNKKVSSGKVIVIK